MSLFNHHDMKTLCNTKATPCVSIYLPMVQAGAETQQNPIRFKNGCREAEAKIAEMTSEVDAKALLSQIDWMHDDYNFWQHQNSGLAIFLTPDSARWFRLGIDTPERVEVGERFLLTPLLPLITGDGRFHVLTLSKNKVRLLMGTRESIRELDGHDIPERIEDVVGYDWEERSLQFHTGTSPSAPGGRRRAMYHGQNISNDKEELETERFLHAVDKALISLLKDNNTPVVLAGVTSITAHFRKLSHYKGLVDGSLSGNMDERDAESLHEAAWALVEPIFKSQQDQASAAYLDRLQAARASSDFEVILPATQEGRVETLLIANNERIWGTWSPETRSITQGKELAPQSEDLLNRAALETIMAGGEIFVLEPEQVPGDSPVAALFRY